MSAVSTTPARGSTRRALFIFRRDLRLTDNTALNAALTECAEVIPCFLLDPRQLEPHPYQSLPALDFMVASLRELDQELRERQRKLYFFWGVAEEILPPLCAAQQIHAVYFNRDYTPFARKRDRALKVALESMGVRVCMHADALLNEPEAVTKSDGSPYTVFTPFFRQASKIAPRAVSALAAGVFYAGALPEDRGEALLNDLPRAALSAPRLQGGRREALKIISQISAFKAYKAERDFPARPGTTSLSAHLKFGTLSAREFVGALTTAFNSTHELIRQLYWRDFYHHIAFHFPHVFAGAFQRQYDQVPWSTATEPFERWCRGETGFPIVDAGMRELRATGYMHNRVRMIVASFLTKDLHISWQWGERYFAQRLIDYDPCVNNGSWQWAASTGCDAQPYFRIFNPWLQQQRFDPECDYIRKWVPELHGCSSEQIQALAAEPARTLGAYPAPMVDHATQKIRAIEIFSKIRGSQAA